MYPHTDSTRPDTKKIATDMVAGMAGCLAEAGCRARTGQDGTELLGLDDGPLGQVAA